MLQGGILLPDFVVLRMSSFWVVVRYRTSERLRHNSLPFISS